MKSQDKLHTALDTACTKIAPVWPLESFVAVNPYMGLIDEDFDAVAERLTRVAGAWMTMPTTFYLEAFAEGRFAETDLQAALRAHDDDTTPARFLAAARLEATREPAPTASVPTVADVGRAVDGTDWDRLVTDRISTWAASYFDQGQATWGPQAGGQGLFQAWRAEAVLDRTPEVMGLRGFRAAVATFPSEPTEAATEALRRLDVPSTALDAYLHRLLVRLGGWAAYAARLDWDERLQGRQSDHLRQLLSVLLVWEAALLEALPLATQRDEWTKAKLQSPDGAERRGPDPSLRRRLILHAAFEHAAERRLVEGFNASERQPIEPDAPTPRAQAVFCIDVRSEVYRRHLEAADPGVQTLGFAGFFGFPVDFVSLGHERGAAQCPVLLTPAATIEEGLREPALEAQTRRHRSLLGEVERAWSTFKMGAVSCFSFVGPVGLAYLPKLFTDAFGLTRPVPHPATSGLDARARDARCVHLEPRERRGVVTGLPLDTQVELATGALRGMSLTKNFARLVLLTGHGSSTVNNPHATGLDCGACGGRTGEANARVASAVLNDPEVRKRLAEKDIVIPDHTHFLACQHDTTTDEVTIFDRGLVPSSHAADLSHLEASMKMAGRSARSERAARMGIEASGPVDAQVLARSRDWAQVRPEWGLAGCSAFVVAPRHRTGHLGLGGRAFLHSYEWAQDEGFGVLELIMTAPMVVASWISLQYYASTVDNGLYGCGDKTLHNVVGTIGVLEGNGGDLRTGLPWQSVHDGQRLQHDPLRLSVVIEAPLEAINEVIEKHEMVRNLFDNHWLKLFAIDASGQVAHAYEGGLKWRSIEDAEESAISLAS